MSEATVIAALPAYTFIETIQTQAQSQTNPATNLTADLLYAAFHVYYDRAVEELSSDEAARGIDLSGTANEDAALSFLIASYIIERNPAWAASSVSTPGGGSVSRSVDSKTGMNISDPERSYNKLLDKIESGELTNTPLIDPTSEMQVHDDETNYQAVREGSYDPASE
jgi:hypothetical protein